MTGVRNEQDELDYQRDREMGDGPEPGDQFGSAPLPLDEPFRARSGSRLTEAQRAATCERSERLQVRLRPGYAARLRALSESDGYSVAEWIETWIEEAEREIAALAKRRKR